MAPTSAARLKVNAFAGGLKHPRWIEVPPNRDVLTAETLQEPGRTRSAFDYALQVTMKRAAAVGTSPNRLTLLRDADGTAGGPWDSAAAPSLPAMSARMDSLRSRPGS